MEEKETHLFRGGLTNAIERKGGNYF